MKKSILSLSIITMAVLFLNMMSAQAIVMPGYERPILTADMEKEEATGHFESAENIVLTMTREDGAGSPTGLTLSYDAIIGYDAIKRRTIDLVIVERRDAGCGSVEYFARLSPNMVAEFNGHSDDHRFSIALTDHTARTCKDLQPHLWEASIREGYGWYGTFDETMEVVGNPQGVFTIQSVQ